MPKPLWIWDAEKKAPDFTCGITDPVEFARYAWDNYPEPTVVDLKYAIDDAAEDRVLYDRIADWAGKGRLTDAVKGKPVSTPDHLKARLYDLLHEQPKPTDKHVFRNEKLVYIARILTREFKLKLSRNKAHTSAVCAASILADLVGAPSEATVAEVCRPHLS